MRYFDIRPYYIPRKGFYTFHNMTWGAELQQILGDLQSFLERNKREIVIFDIRRFRDVDPHLHLQLVRDIVHRFGRSLVPPPSGNDPDKPLDLTPRDIWNENQNLIVRYGPDERMLLPVEYQEIIWEGFPFQRNGSKSEKQKREERMTSQEPYAQTSSLAEFESFMEEALGIHEAKPEKDEFYVLQGVLTPVPKFITEQIAVDIATLGIRRPNISKFGGSIKKDLAPKVISSLTDKLHRDWGQKDLNIVTADFYDEAFVDAVIRLNY